MIRTLILLAVCTCLAFSAEPEGGIAIGAHNLHLPQGWVSATGKGVVAKRMQGEQLIAVMMASALKGPAKDESDQMATMTPEKAAFATLVKHDTFPAFNGRDGIRVFMKFKLAEGETAFYSWYIDLGKTSHTIKLKCPVAHAEPLSKEIDSMLRKVAEAKKE